MRAVRRLAGGEAGVIADAGMGIAAAKLGPRDRVQVAVFAYEHGIVRPGHP